MTAKRSLNDREDETARVHRAVLLGWARSLAGPTGRGTSDCTDEVILARKGVKSRRRITSLRSKTTKAKTHG